VGKMLFADKLALENRTKVRLLLIRERELNLYVQNCRAVGTVAALLAGLAFSSLVILKPGTVCCLNSLPLYAVFTLLFRLSSIGYWCF